MNGYKSSQNTSDPSIERRDAEWGDLCVDVYGCEFFGCTANDGCALCNVDMTVIQIHEATLVDFSHANVLIRSQRLPPLRWQKKFNLFTTNDMAYHISASDY